MAEWKRKRVGLSVAASAAIAVALAAIGPAAAAPGKGHGRAAELAPVLMGPSAPATSGVDGLAAGAPGAGTVVEVIVRGRGFSGDSAADAAAREVKEAGGTAGDEVPLVGGVVAEMPLEEAQRLDAEPGVVVVPNERVSPAARPNKYAIQTAYPFSMEASDVWVEDDQTGLGVGVAVVDSGVADLPDFAGRLIHVNVNPAYGTGDGFGHGTHVAGTIAGRSAGDSFVGVAPDARIIDVKVLDANGLGDLATILNGLQWVSRNAAAHNIRVVNISLGTDTPLRYTEHPLNAAVEALWRQGLIVVVAAGNSGASTDAVSRAPANDPYVITVGASDERGTRSTLDDQPAEFSSRGVTRDGFSKPEIYAPGVGIVAPSAPGSHYARTYPSAVTGGQIRMSGSSMATAVISGVVTLMIGEEPQLTPDLVKSYLVDNGESRAGVRVADADRAVGDTSAVKLLNQGLTPAPALGTVWGTAEATASWAKASWARASWARGAAG